MSDNLDSILAKKTLSSNFSLGDDLTASEKFKLSLGFKMKSQGEFITEYMKIKTSGKVPLADLIVFSRMNKHIGIMRGENSCWAIVCRTLIKRLDAGISMSKSMTGLFDTSFISLFRSMGAASNLTDAVHKSIQILTELNKAKRLSNIKIGVGLGSVFLGYIVAHFIGVFFYEQKEDFPKAFRWVETPDVTFAIGDLIWSYGLILLPMIFVLFSLQSKALRSYTGSARDNLDTWWPFARIYKMSLSIEVFGAIGLLVKDAGLDIQTALQKLHENSNEYTRSHLDIMLVNIASGKKGTMQLNTGLLTKDLELSLMLAGEGEGATVSNAIELIATQGTESLIAGFKSIGTATMFGFIIASSIVFAKAGLAGYDAITAIGG